MDADRDSTSTRSTPRTARRRAAGPARRRRAAPLGFAPVGNAPLGIAPLALGLLLLAAGAPAGAANNDDLMRLLEQRRCPGCRLQDADLVHAELRDADLQSAILKRANLSGALLDGAQLQGADLSFTSLVGASLRGADLRGARLEGIDLRQSDLSGAQLDAGALERTHWQQARGAAPGSLGYAALHNAGVAAAEAGRFQEAEVLFGDALRQQPQAAITWVARGICRTEQGNIEMAAKDLRWAAGLYQEAGDSAAATQMTAAANQLEAPAKKTPGGNGLGSQLLNAGVGVVKMLAPLAMKTLSGL